MFKNKKFLSIFIAETVMPWVVALLGMFAVSYFNSSGQYYRARLMEEYERAEKIFEIIFRVAMLYGLGLLIALLITGTIAFILVLANLAGRKKQKYCVARPLVIWIYSGACILGTLILMFLVMGFTYGMSV